MSQFVKKATVEEIVARLAALDGTSTNCITKSDFIRESIHQRGYSLPKNNQRVMQLVHSFYLTAKAEVINKIENLKNQNEKFAINLDEWTSLRNRKYLNINIHHVDTNFNLGLVPVYGSCNAGRILELVQERLAEFNLNIITDVISATNDGAAVMVSFGKLSKIINQECYSHAFHLAVMDVLYKEKTTFDEIEDILDCNSDIDSDNSLATSEPDIEITYNYKECIQRIRKIC